MISSSASAPTGPTQTRAHHNQRGRGHLVLRDLRYASDDGAVLDGIDLDARAGTRIHVIAPACAEATALLGVLVGLYTPTAGSIALDDVDLGQLPIQATRHSLALVLREPWIMSGTVAENIAFGDPSCSRHRVDQVATLARVDELARRLPAGLDTKVGDGGVALTAGQRRRIALARTLLRDPDVLLVEDPLRDLSASDETEALRALDRARVGRTTIVTAQRLDASAFGADQVLHLEGGRLIDPSPTGSSSPAGMAPTSDAAEALDAAEETAIGPGTELAPGLVLGHRLHRDDVIETWTGELGSAENGRLVEVRLARAGAAEPGAVHTEFELAGRLLHPGLLRPLRSGFVDDTPFAVYEWVAGRRLCDGALPPAADRLAPSSVVSVGAELARTLAYLHRRGYAHGSLRPEAVRIAPEGVIITDLRRTRPLGRTDDPADDLYDLGTVLLWISTHAAEDRLGTGSGTAPTSPTIEPELASVIADLLRPDPDERPTAARALARLQALFRPPPERSGRSRPPDDDDLRDNTDLGDTASSGPEQRPVLDR